MSDVLDSAFAQNDPPPRMPGPVPEWAKNQTHLGRCLMPPRDRKIIQQAMKLEGNPGRTSDGRYNVAQWQEFISHHFKSASLVGQPGKQTLELEKLRLNVAKLQFELDVKRKDFSANADIERWVGDLVMNAKRILQQIPSKMAPQLVGRDEIAIEKILKEEINSALLQLTARPLDAG